MKKTMVIIAALFFLGAFVAPSFATVTANYAIVAVDDEPKAKTEDKSDKKEADKKGECTKSAEKKAECAKDKPACDKK